MEGVAAYFAKGRLPRGEIDAQGETSPSRKKRYLLTRNTDTGSIFPLTMMGGRGVHSTDSRTSFHAQLSMRISPAWAAEQSREPRLTVSPMTV